MALVAYFLGCCIAQDNPVAPGCSERQVRKNLDSDHRSQGWAPNSASLSSPSGSTVLSADETLDDVADEVGEDTTKAGDEEVGETVEYAIAFCDRCFHPSNDEQTDRGQS